MKKYPPVPDPWEEVRRIQLTVKNPSGKKVLFNIKRSTPLRKLMCEYCRPLALLPHSVRFFVDGSNPVKRISLNDTACQLGLKDGDKILFFRLTETEDQKQSD